MTKHVEKHYEEIRQKQARIDDLQKSIADNEKALNDSRQEYKVAVIEDADHTDQLFQSIEQLENKIKADKHKLSTLEAVTSEFLRNDALKVINGFLDDVHAKHKTKVDAALKTIEKAKKEYIKALSVLDGLNESYHTERKEYEGLLRRYHFTRKDVNDRRSLVYRIEDPSGIAPSKTQMGITSKEIEEGLNR